MTNRTGTPARVFSCTNLVLLFWTLAILAAIRAFFLAQSGIGPWGWWAIATLVLLLAAIATRVICSRRARAAPATRSAARPAGAVSKSAIAGAGTTGPAGSRVGSAGDTGKSREMATAPTASGKPEVAATGGNGATATERDLEEEETAAKLADLPSDASPEERADAVGTRPSGLDGPDGGNADDLKRIKGIGRVNEGKLNALGIYHFRQIAAWGRPEVRWVTTYLAFPGRIDREDWLGQAEKLSSGAETDFSRRVAAGEVASSLDESKA